MPSTPQSAGLETLPASPPRSTRAGSTFRPGDLVADRFRIIRLVGRGSAGEIYLAEDLVLRTQVALKTLLPEAVSDRRKLTRFLREVNLARQVTHANACRIYDLFRHIPAPTHGSSAPFHVVSMEFLDGEPLSNRLGRRGPLPTEEAMPIIAQIAAGLAAAHEVGIVHCDLKDSNVMLVEATCGERAVITDFGLATVDATLLGTGHDGAPNGDGDFVGTPAFMSPEQVLGDQLTTATDIYALGILMYRMVTGKLPFLSHSIYATAFLRIRQDPVPPAELVSDLDPHWNDAILRCLERSPEDRFASSLELVEALERWAAEAPRPELLLT